MTDDVTGKKMVVGFLFSGAKVLLVQKTHPSWQAGMMNGVGGVVESDETPIAAMIREFREETSHQEALTWRHFCTEVEPFGAYVYFYAATLSGSRAQFAWPGVNDVGEPLRWTHVNDVQWSRCLGNLRWLVPLALDWRGLDPVVVTARGDIREKATW